MTSPDVYNTIRQVSLNVISSSLHVESIRWKPQQSITCSHTTPLHCV